MIAPYRLDFEKDSVCLDDPKQMSKAGGFLWNKKMMLQMNCRGYAVSQFMQPEPSKYAFGPALEASTFMQPEHHYYPQHPGRFFYIKNQTFETTFSIPFEPMRIEPERYTFEVLSNRIEWTICYGQLEVRLGVQLTPNDTAELWYIRIANTGDCEQTLSLYPYFPLGYQSWMNQSADYCYNTQGIIAKKVTPYQKLEDYWKNRNLKELSFLISETEPDAWCANANQFEGWGGLTNPDGVAAQQLNNAPALYDVPVASLQFDVSLTAGEAYNQRFIFGAARDTDEIQQLRRQHLSKSGFNQALQKTASYLNQVEPAVHVQTEDTAFDQFINLWLPRQVFYHGDVDRLTTDPQTRNYLQDGMGMIFLDSAKAREKIIRTLSQQHQDGSLPDGILLNEAAELKYINTVPHSDHCVWLPICLHTYICETGDVSILDIAIPFADNPTPTRVFEHLEQAMQWLKDNMDERGLSLIHQGDWCDPMNMVGHQGKGVSAWLSMATSYAWQRWADICDAIMQQSHANRWNHHADVLNKNIIQFFWHDKWFARGITDEGRTFGIKQDQQGSIYLNPQSWAMLAGVVDTYEADALIAEVEQHLGTPYGLEMLGPPYTEMVEDIGRLTQKFPGTAENGSVYNHAAAFYAFALYQQGKSEQGYAALARMLVTPEDALQREQLPVFIPNYYRGAMKQHPSHAGRSSQLFNTGTVAWFYRCIVEGLFGVSGTFDGLEFNPQLPNAWSNAKVVRRFRGARFNIQYKRRVTFQQLSVYVDGQLLDDNVFKHTIAGKEYQVDIHIPRETT